MTKNLVHGGGQEGKIFDKKCKFAKGYRGVFIDKSLSFEEWRDLILRFVQLNDAIQFTIGDLLAYGYKNFEERSYDDALLLVNKTKHTLQNWTAVCLAIPPEERIYDLSFGHYEAVAKFNKEVRDDFLRLAATENLSVHKLRLEIKRQSLPKENMFGKPINVAGLAHAPINEQGVVFLFALVCEKLGFRVEAVQQPCPDCIAKRKIETRKGIEVWKSVRIEFEFRSYSFKLHNHDPNACDLIVCWIHDWQDCPLEVIALEKELAQGNI